MLRDTELIIVERMDDAEHYLGEIDSLPIVATDIFFYSLRKDTRPVILLAGTDKRHYLFDLRILEFDIARRFFKSRPLKIMVCASDKIVSLYQFEEIWIENITDIVVLEQIISNNYFFPPEIRGLDDLSMKYLGIKAERGKRMLVENLSGEIGKQLIEFARIELLAIFRIFLEQVKSIKALSLEQVARLESNVIRAFARIQHRGIFFDASGFKRLLSGSLVQNLLSENMLLDESQVVRLFRDPSKVGIRLSGLLSEFERSYKEPAHTLYQNANEILKRIKMPESRLHSKFIQISSASGRSSSQSPNLFAIPKARIFREYFSAPQNRLIITLDYSIFELGVLAALSKDPHFLKAFKERIDLHSYVAKMIFGKDVSKTENSELRKRAKTINFGIVYGMTVPGLAKRLGIGRQEATRLLNRYYRAFPTLYVYLQNSANDALMSGDLRTLSGRRCSLNPLGTMNNAQKRILSKIISRVGKKKGEIFAALLLTELENQYFKRVEPSEEMYIKRLENVLSESNTLPAILRNIDNKIQDLYRFARNMPIQGTAADIMKKAITDIDKTLYTKGLDASIVNIVHDEIVIETAEDIASDVAFLARDIMVSVSSFFLRDISIDVDVNIGRFWGDSSENRILQKG